MNAILLIVGLGLLGVSDPPLPREGVATPEAASPRTAAPDPLPQLDLPGLPPPQPSSVPAVAARTPVPLQPPAESALPALVRQAPAAPERPPAFRPVKPPPAANEPDPSPRVAAPRQDTPAPTVQRPGGAQTPTIAVDKIGPTSVSTGEPLVYEIVVRNIGQVPALRLIVEDELPAGTRILSADPQPFVQGNHLAWQLEGMTPGEEKHFHVQVQPGAAGEWLGTATVIVSASRTLQTNVRGALPPATPAGQVFLDLRGPDGDAVQGHPLVFELRVSNTGSVPLTGVILHAHLPAGLEHRYGSDIELNLDPLGPGEARTEKLEVIAMHAGRHVAEVSVRAAKVAPVVVRAAATVRDDPILGIRLIGPREGWTDRVNDYRIEVYNRAPTEVREVILVEHLPPGLAVVTAPPGGAYDAATQTLRWKLGNLVPGQKRVLPIKLLARAAGPALHDITAQTAQGHVAQLQTVLKFWPPRASAGTER